MAEDVGRMSEWNEGTFKSIRLHEIQDRINDLRHSPLGITKGKFNYHLMAIEVNNLYLEGYSKYKATERRDTDKIRDLIFNIINYNPPSSMMVSQEIEGTKKGFVVNKELLLKLVELIEVFERKVKHLNDEHGLTTSNRQYGGLF